MIARFASRCRLCSGTIAVGDAIQPVAFRGFVHASCPRPPGSTVFWVGWKPGAFASAQGRRWVESGAAPAEVTLEEARWLCDRWGVSATLYESEGGKERFRVGYKIVIPL